MIPTRRQLPIRIAKFVFGLLEDSELDDVISNDINKQNSRRSVPFLEQSLRVSYAASQRSKTTIKVRVKSINGLVVETLKLGPVAQICRCQKAGRQEAIPIYIQRKSEYC